MKFIPIIIMIMLLSCCVENNSKNEETTPKVTDQEKELLVVIDELGINHSSSYNGTFSKGYTEQGGYYITYEYETPKDSNESKIFIISEVDFETSREEAKKDFNVLVKSFYSTTSSKNYTTLEKRNSFREMILSSLTQRKVTKLGGISSPSVDGLKFFTSLVLDLLLIIIQIYLFF